MYRSGSKRKLRMNDKHTKLFFFCFFETYKKNTHTHKIVSFNLSLSITIYSWRGAYRLSIQNHKDNTFRKSEKMFVNQNENKTLFWSKNQNKTKIS